MLKFPPELIVHRGNVLYLLYVVGGLLMTATAGSPCVDVVVKTVQSPANLQRLSNTVFRLMGIGSRLQAKSRTPLKIKRLIFFESFISLLDTTKPLQGPLSLNVLLVERKANLRSTSSNFISAKRCRIYFIFLCGVRKREILTLCIGDKGSKLTIFKTANQLQWLISFSREAQGDLIFLLLRTPCRQISTGYEANDANEQNTNLNLGLSLLFLLLLWIYWPYIAVFALFCLGLKVKKNAK